MRKIVHSLTLLLVLYHSLVGCCWHHAHGEEQAPRTDASDDVTCCGHSHQGHDHGREPSEAPSRNDTGCEHGKCVFFVPPTADVAGIADSVATSNGLYSDVLQDGIVRSKCSDVRESPPCSARPPLRLHLVNQILLI